MINGNTKLQTKFPVSQLASKSIKAVKKTHEQSLKNNQNEAKSMLKAEIKKKLKLTKETASNVRSKVYSESDAREASLFIKSAVSYFDTHRKGSLLKPKKGAFLYIPVTAKGKRLKKATFQKMIESLKQQGLIFYKRQGDKLLVFAKVKTGSKSMSFFKRSARERMNKKSIKSGESVLVAIGIKESKLKKRLDVFSVRKKIMDKVANETISQSNVKLDNIYN